jgi:hypothetical protein
MCENPVEIAQRSKTPPTTPPPEPVNITQVIEEIAKEVKEFKDENKELRAEFLRKSKDPSFQPKMLSCKFIDITKQGKAVVGFSQDVRIIQNLTIINNGTIYADEVGLGRLLAEKKKERVPIL